MPQLKTGPPKNRDLPNLKRSARADINSGRRRLKEGLSVMLCSRLPEEAGAV